MASSSSASLHAIFLFMLVFSLNESSLHAGDTITVNRPLSGNQKLISLGEKFALGFFQPAGESVSKWYIGIWFNKIPMQTIVWVANRDKPIADPTSSKLTISDDGNLVLLNHSKFVVWSTNVSKTASNSAVGVLLNTGNLVVRHASNTSAVLWQSFDHLTDTWLPGSKLSRNKVTGEIKHLISWKAQGDPAVGKFSVQLDPNGSNQYILLLNNSIEYWASGNWTGKIFTGMPELDHPSSIFTFQFVDNDHEAYFTYDLKGDTIFIRNLIDVSGQYQTWIWEELPRTWILLYTQPMGKCSVYATCGGFSKCTESAFPPCSCLRGFSNVSPNNWKLGDQTAGCERNIPLQCGSNSSTGENKDRFYVISDVRLPNEAHSIVAATIHRCEFICLNNCSCTAYFYNGTCLHWYGSLLNLQEILAEPGDSIFVRLAASELPDSEPRKSGSLE